MQVAADVAMHAARFMFEDIKIIHARLMAGAVSAALRAGVIRSTHDWLGGNDSICLWRRFTPIIAALNQSASR